MSPWKFNLPICISIQFQLAAVLLYFYFLYFSCVLVAYLFKNQGKLSVYFMRNLFQMKIGENLSFLVARLLKFSHYRLH